MTQSGTEACTSSYWRPCQMLNLSSSLYFSFKTDHLSWRPLMDNAAENANFETVSPKALFLQHLCLGYIWGRLLQYTYADDTALGIADVSFDTVEAKLQQDLITVSHYFQRWHLKLSKPKTVSSVFHLANRCSKRELNINLDGVKLSYDPTPKYLGVIFRSVTFHQHIKAVVAKTQSRVNLLRKLAGTGWGCILLS